MKANNGYRKPTGAELRAQRIAREVQATPAEEARRRERKLLDGLGGAADDLEWLATNQAWVLLGHDTCAAWWEARVRPVAEALGFEPTRELGMRFVELIRAEEAALPPAQRRSNKELAAFVGVSEWAARGRQDPRQRRSAAYVDHGGPVVDGTFTEDSKPADIAAALTQAIEETAAHTSAAGPAASTGGAFPPAGETGPEPAPNGLGSAGPEPVVTGLGSGPQNSPAAESASSPHAGVPAAGVNLSDYDVGAFYEFQERIEEEAAEPPADLPAAAATSLPDGGGDPKPEQSQQPGHNSPTGVEGPRSEADSPTGLEAVQPRDDRSETDHHTSAGVSGVGEAPEVASTDPVEPVELEDGAAAVTPSSSVLDVPGNPAERLLLAVAALVHYLDQLDVDAVGPLLLGPDVEQLFSHAEEISAHITRIGKARFAEMLTP